jgi:hypothetical protein
MSEMRTQLLMAALAAALLPAAAAASPVASGSPLQNPSLAASVVDVAATTLVAGSAPAPPAFALVTPFAGGVGYRPRAYRSRAAVMPTTTQIHVGFFDPTDDFSTGFVGGFRMGPQVDPHVQLGLAVDWWHKSDNATLDLGSVPLPGGTGTERLVLSKSSADLLPILAFVQVSGDENLPVIPYGGFGVGYEWLFLTADNYLTSESFDQTFGGFGWQVWGGAGIPLDGRTRVNGEVFFNGSEVGSDMDVYIPDYGAATVRDVVKMNGLGMRFGISWGF